MSRLPSPLATEPDEFKAAAKLIRALPPGKLRVRISPTSQVNYWAERSLLKEHGAKAGLEPDLIFRVLGEISQLSSAILNKNIQPLLGSLVDNASVETESEKETIQAALKNKATLVEKMFVTDELQRRFLLARTSKHERLLGVDWEIVEKRFDKDRRDQVRGSVALVRIDLARQRTKEGLWFLGLLLGESGTEHETFVLECDEADLAELIDALEGARVRLVQSSSIEEG